MVWVLACEAEAFNSISRRCRSFCIRPTLPPKPLRTVISFSPSALCANDSLKWGEEGGIERKGIPLKGSESPRRLEAYPQNSGGHGRCPYSKRRSSQNPMPKSTVSLPKGCVCVCMFECLCFSLEVGLVGVVVGGIHSGSQAYESWCP